MFEEERRPLQDDDDLGKRAKHDDFLIKRIFKFAMLFSAVTILIFLTLAFCQQFIANDDFRKSVLETIKTNMVTIVVVGLGIIGFNVRK